MENPHEVPEEVSNAFSADSVFAAALRRLEEIKVEIAYQKDAQKKSAARVRDLHEEQAKTQRIVSAMTPRTRTKRPKA